MTLRENRGSGGSELPLPALCVLSDPAHEADRAVDELLRLLNGGVGWVQLRTRKGIDRDLFSAARRLAAEAPAGAMVTLNDRCDIALAAGLTSVHLGEEDLPVEAARKFAGDRLVLGVSTHSPLAAKNASPAADYVALGPIFPTSSKISGHEPVGTAGIAEARSLGVSRPLVAIGGITRAGFRELFAAGATSLAVIGAVWSAPDPVSTAVDLARSAEAIREELIR